MRRPTNFRIWDNEKKRWYEPTYEAYKGKLEELLISASGRLGMRTLKDGREILIDESKFEGRFVVCWPTTLKDKNGKEIYDGDILESWQSGNYGRTKRRHLRVVEWHENIGGFGLTRVDNAQIIGNIYENPELLK